MSLRAGTAFVDLAPRLASNFEKDADQQIGNPISRVAGKAGKLLAAGLATGAAAAVAFGIKSSKAFADVGTEVNKLIRYTGGSAEAMSKLRFSAKDTGVDVDVLGVGLKNLSKHLVANDKAAKAMGISYRDSTGKIKPLDSVIAALSDKFAKMPNGPEKSALALQLFGKAGTDLIPLLNKGADGLDALGKKAEQFGQVLSQDNLDAIKKNSAAHREWQEVLQGLQVQVGAYILPLITAFVTLLTRALMPAIRVVADLTRDYLAPAFDWAFGIIGKVMGAVIDFATGTLAPGIKTVVADIVGFLTPAFTFIGNLVTDYIVPAFQTGWHIVLSVIGAVASYISGTLWPAFKSAIGLIIGVLNPFYERAKEIFDGVKKKVGETSDKVEGPLLKALHKVGDYVNDHLAPILAVGISGAGFAVIANQVVTAAGAIASFIAAVAVLPAVVGIVALIVVAVAALVAGLIYAYTHFEAFRNVVDTVGRALRDGFKAALDFITEQVGNLAAYFDRIWPQIQEAVTHVMNVIRDIITIAVNVISALWRAWGDDLLRLVMTAWDFIRAIVADALQFIRGIIQLVLAIINGDWGKAWDAIKLILSAILDAMWSYIVFIFESIKSVFGGFISTIQQVWAGLWDTLKTALQAGLRIILVGFLDFVGLFIHGASTLFGWVPGIGDKLKDASKAFDKFKDDVNASLGGIKDRNIKVTAEITGRGETIKTPNGVTKALADGGRFTNEPAIVGEDGIELLNRGTGHVTNNRDLAAMLHQAVAAEGGGMGRGEVIHIDEATFVDPVDVDTLFQKADFLAGAGAF